MNTNTETPVIAKALDRVIRQQKQKILIAEDDAVASRVLKLTLEKFGHEVIVAGDGAEAWETFDKNPVRVIVSDWMMPRMDGLELCAKVRARPQTPYAYFILLTANGDSAENYSKAMAAGVDDFLNKPLDREMARMRLVVAERILGYATEIRQLKDLIPMCMYCHQVRNDSDYWERVESYIHSQTGTKFSHGICPQCYEAEMAALMKEC